MVVEIVVAVVLLAAGFAAGRVKNAAKLKAIETEVQTAETSVVSEVKTLVARIKALL
jgi:hypothetical protein